MALLTILQFPDPRLKKIAEPVEVFDQEISKLVEDLQETMVAVQGAGLAATQVNVHKRVLIVEDPEQPYPSLCLINPDIIEKRGTIERDEGCLSFPGVYAKIMRAKEIDILYYDKLGKHHQLSAEGKLAHRIQHEIDHLNGITFYDHLSSLKQTMLRTKLDKFRRKVS